MRNSRFYRQFVITNRTDKALTFTLDPDTAVLKNGEATLPVSFRSVGFIETREPSNFKLQYPIGKYPAPLLPLKNRTVTVLPESNQSLFIEVFVPENQPAGKYTGNICMGDIKLPVVCDVLAAALPQRSTLRSTVGCWSLSPQLLKKIGWQGTAAEFQKKCRMLVYRHRLTPRENGVNWNSPDLEKQFQELHDNHAVSLAVPMAVLKNPKLMALLKKHGLYNHAFYYTIDEAPASLFPKVVEISKGIHAQYPDFKVLGTIYEEDVSALYGAVNIWCRSSIKREPWHEARAKPEMNLCPPICRIFTWSPLLPIR